MSYSNSSTVPIEMLPGIGRRTAKVLRTMQVRTVGEFKSLPEGMLVVLFGPSIRPVHATVRGRRHPAFKASWLGMLKSALALPDQEFDPVRRYV